MTPLLTAVASLALAIVVIAAFALWLRYCLNHRAKRVARSTAADPGMQAHEAIDRGDGGSD